MMTKYNCLLNLKQLKQQFVLDFLAIFSKLPTIELKEKWNLISSREFNDWVRISGYENTHTSKSNDYFKYLEENFKNIPKEKHEILQLSPIEYYLVDKVEHIIICRGDFSGAIRMLKSFMHGTKNLPVLSWNHDEQYYYEEKNGIEKLRHSKNLEKAHFRWNYGKRYTLDWGHIEKINYFLYNNVL